MHEKLKTSSGVPQLLQISTQYPQNHSEQTKIVCYRTFRLQNPKSFHYQRKDNNRTQGLIELQYIQLTPMTSNALPMLEELISKPTSLKYIPINNQINNIKIILFNINFKNFKKLYNHEKLNNVWLGGLIHITHPYISPLAVT